MSGEHAIVVDSLSKTFRIGFRRKVVDAVRSIHFSVPTGSIFGFLGPNGAGKTTTIKMCMDLIRPTAGSVLLLGQPPSSIAARRRTGYLPEQPYFYDYLKPGEILDFFGRLYGIGSAERKQRIRELLALVGLEHAAGRTLRKFSKGMLQRVGLAQALIARPDLVVLDEPLSGLDPIGRKEFKDIIVSLKERGCTVFFSSHILADIEMLCDGIAIVDRGRIRYTGSTRDFMAQGQTEVEVLATGVSADTLAAVSKLSVRVERLGTGACKLLLPQPSVTAALGLLLGAGAVVDAVVPRSETLEDIFVRTATGKGEKP
jgi:ABC-2 type transport system ATP-binding protein